MKHGLILIMAALAASGCSTMESALGGGSLDTPPEFNQEIILDASDQVEMFQAPRSTYDPGDLQNFHTQHTFPVLVEDAFKELFGKVTLHEKKEADIQAAPPDVPAIFEAKLIDVANDIYMEADNYRGEVTIAVAMKSPQGTIFWQEAFRGQGFAYADPQHGSHLGPQDALVDAVWDALHQMQKAIISSPQVRQQMRYYKQIDDARRQQEALA